jgi:4-hydroxybenzoyl-CoA reductase subunit beta
MLRNKEFDLAIPDTLEEALAMLARDERSMVIAGGTDLVPKLKRGQFEPSTVVSLSRLKGLDYVKTAEDGLRIGSRATLRSLEQHPDVLRFPAIAEAVRQVATPIIRNNATIGGNLLQDTRCRFYDRGVFWRDAVGYCMKKDGEDCRVAPGGDRCYAVFCSDIAPALIVHDAQVRLAGEKERTIPLEDIYLDDGMRYLDMNNEILLEIIVPQRSRLSTYRKMRMRGGFDFPEAGVAVAIEKDEDGIAVSIAVTAIGSRVLVVRDRITPAGISDLADHVYRTMKPMDALSLSPAYRKAVTRNMIVKALNELLAA